MNREPRVERLLTFDLHQFARKLDLVDSVDDLSDSEAVELLNYAERLSRHGVDDTSRNLCLVICGIIWEHRQSRWTALPGFMVQVLSRIGLGPSTRMVDTTFDVESGKYSSLGSLLAEVQITGLHSEFEVQAGTRTLLLSSFQKKLWTAIDDFDRLCVSAPTSAGKSYILVEKIASILLERDAGIVYIVPTLSLIQQVTSDLRSAFLAHGLEGVDIAQSYDSTAAAPARKTVYVLTQERSLAALAHSNAFSGIYMLVVDEVQNIERVSSQDDDRARTLYEVIQAFGTDIRPPKIIVSGPRLKDPGRLAKQLFGPSAESVSADIPPVVSLTYTFQRQKSQILLRQYSTVRDEPLTMILPRSTRIDAAVFGQQQYSERFVDFLAYVVERLNADGSTLIFSPTSRQAGKTATALAATIKQEPKAELDSLAAYIRQSVHQAYALADTIPSAVAFHHGKMPLHARNAVEKAFGRSIIRTLACTTTLMQGVNLPAKNLIARNPNLFVKRRSPEDSPRLTSYEFANLRGRAGRLMKDFVGRAVVLDEGSFEDAEISFDFPEKEVGTGYGSRFQANRDEIIQDVLSNEPAREEFSDSDLVIYIRQMVLRYKADAASRMARAGVVLSDSEYEQTAALLSDLAVPEDICAKLLFWDPLALERIYETFQSGELSELPKSPFEYGYDRALRAVMDDLKGIVPYYYERYFGSENERYLTTILITARRWSQEDPLREIITWNTDRHVSAEEIDRRLQVVNQMVMYNLPKLLRPVQLMQDPENGVLTQLELGAYRPETRRFLDFGIVREIAIKLAAILRARRLTLPAIQHDSGMVGFIRENAGQLHQWERIQLSELVPQLPE